VGLRPLVCWNRGFESRLGGGHGSLSVMSVVCCQVEVSATGRSLVQRSPECDREYSITRRLWPTGGALLCHGKKKSRLYYVISLHSQRQIM